MPEAVLMAELSYVEVLDLKDPLYRKGRIPGLTVWYIDLGKGWRVCLIGASALMCWCAALTPSRRGGLAETAVRSLVAVTLTPN